MQVLEARISWGRAPRRHREAAQSSTSLRYTHVVCKREKLFRTAPANAGRDLCKFLQHSVEMLLRNAFCNGVAIVSFGKAGFRLDNKASRSQTFASFSSAPLCQAPPGFRMHICAHAEWRLNGGSRL